MTFPNYKFCPENSTLNLFDISVVYQTRKFDLFPVKVHTVNQQISCENYSCVTVNIHFNLFSWVPQKYFNLNIAISTGTFITIVLLILQVSIAYTMWYRQYYKVHIAIKCLCESL